MNPLADQRACEYARRLADAAQEIEDDMGMLPFEFARGAILYAGAVAGMCARLEQFNLALNEANSLLQRTMIAAHKAKFEEGQI